MESGHNFTSQIGQLYTCKICETTYEALAEAQKCLLQGQPPELLPRGTVFRRESRWGNLRESPAQMANVGQVQDNLPVRQETGILEVGKGVVLYIILRHQLYVCEEGHRNVYKAVTITRFPEDRAFYHRRKVIVSRDGQTIGWDGENPPRILTPAEVEEGCKEDPFLRRNLDEILRR